MSPTSQTFSIIRHQNQYCRYRNLAFCKWYKGGILGSILLSLFLQVDDQIDLFISQRGFESILYYLIFVVFLLSIFPSTDVSNPVSHTVWLIPNLTLVLVLLRCGYSSWLCPWSSFGSIHWSFRTVWWFFNFDPEFLVTCICQNGCRAGDSARCYETCLEGESVDSCSRTFVKS